MSQHTNDPMHPGSYVREHVLPPGLSVTDTAKRLGVGRPALSNLLNGNSSLSPEMALRLEKTFGANAQDLLQMQLEFERTERQGAEKSIPFMAYVPAFLTIKARQIREWPELNLEARQLLPVLLRKLVHSTGQELSEVDFPGYDNAERKGNDGRTMAGGSTPWIPAGRAIWEFGVSQDPRRKASHDYMNRTGSIPASERRESTFIFVTPRDWPGKDDWVRSKQSAGDWMAVRAYDASDLEQWLEVSIPAQMWFAEILEMPVEGFETLERFWTRWSSASEPNVARVLFAPPVNARRAEFREWLAKDYDQPYVIAADSKEEALAFLACLFRDTELKGRWGDLPVIFESPETLRKLMNSTAPFIPVVYTDEVERELAAIICQRHSIVVRPRNAVGIGPEQILDRLDHASFMEALARMGVERDEAERLARESGHSPTILRRRLATLPAVRVPPWAGDTETARQLIPIALAGAWTAASEADREAVSSLAGTDYADIESSVAQLMQFDDVPVWSTGQHRGVASKIDALFAVASQIIPSDLDRFFSLAKEVLSESDPALELPEDERWAAGAYGKVRRHSDALREGVCESLIVLALHGDDLFGNRLGISAEAGVASLISSLLLPMSLEKLQSQEGDLPRYAEAAPEVFLRAVERDLRQGRPVILGLLKPVSTGSFGHCPRSGLLWGLECLAWRYLPRVSSILAQLSKVNIDDNWANKPINSLNSIYKSWMPQTAASIEDRIRSLERIAKHYPEIGWKICMDQLRPGGDVGDFSYRPRWRSDASGAGQPVSRRESVVFIQNALQIALEWPNHDGATLSDLVERIRVIPKHEQERIWDLIDAWAENETDDDEKARLSERIRQFVLTRLGRTQGLSDEVRNRAQGARERLIPVDFVARHAWLFANRWIDLSASDVENDDLDAAYSTHEMKIDRLRALAIEEIWEASGFPGIVALLSGGSDERLAGEYLAKYVTDVEECVEILHKCLSSAGELERLFDGFMQGFLEQVEDDWRDPIISSMVESDDIERTVRLFRCAPFGRETWRLLDEYGEETRSRYWQDIFPYVFRHEDSEITEMIDRLLEANRPLAALNAVKLDWSRIETSRLRRLLADAARGDDERLDHFQINPYHISKALKALDERPEVSKEEMAQLEFLYITALDFEQYRISNLEAQVVRSPAFFVQLLAVAFKRNDGGQDPEEWQVEESRRRSMWEATIRVLEGIKLIPGTNSDGTIDVDALYDWMVEARRQCAQHGRAEIGDEYIGQLLSRADRKDGDVWSCMPVCDVMERVASEHIGTGFSIGVQNARGVVMRQEGGAQERELASMYRAKAALLAIEYPYVSTVFEDIAAIYDREAEWHDDREAIEQRLWQ